MTALVYDAGALVAAEHLDPGLLRLHQRALARGDIPVVPSVVLAQAWRGGPQAVLSRVLDACVIVDVGEELAREAGRLLGLAAHDDVVDAVVVAQALLANAAVVTSDRSDIAALAAAAGRRLAVLDV